MKTYLYALFIVLFVSCNSNEQSVEEVDIDYTVQNEEDILKYIKENNLDAKKSDSGLYYVIENEGTGNRPTVNSDVTVAYKGYFLNGSTFDESDANGITFNLQQVIAGWREGITYFKEGGNGVLLVPSKLGYGSSDFRGIPGGSVLVFDVKLLEIK